VFEALKRFFRNDDESKSVAKSRLSFVLVQDRTGLSSEEMSKFKQEMVEVIEKYFAIEKNGLDITYKRDGDCTTLLINSPVFVRRLDGPAARSSGRHGNDGKHGSEKQGSEKQGHGKQENLNKGSKKDGVRQAAN